MDGVLLLGSPPFACRPAGLVKSDTKSHLDSAAYVSMDASLLNFSRYARVTALVCNLHESCIALLFLTSQVWPTNNHSPRVSRLYLVTVSVETHGVINNYAIRRYTGDIAGLKPLVARGPWRCFPRGWWAWLQEADLLLHGRRGNVLAVAEIYSLPIQQTVDASGGDSLSTVGRAGPPRPSLPGVGGAAR